MADSYDFNYQFTVTQSGSPAVTADFVITTTSTDSTGPTFPAAQVTGTFGGVTITGLDATFDQPDNLTGVGTNFFDGVDGFGVSFDLSNGDKVNIFNGSGLDVNEADSNNNTLIFAAADNVVFSNNSPACFVRGTKLTTPYGRAAIETLRIGDLLTTGGGAQRAIKWIGRRRYGGQRAAIGREVQPIRFRAGALGNGLPSRDLLVSPRHAMLIDGYLIEADDLVNGHSITREHGLSAVEYFHVEFATHDVVLAEDCWSESFADHSSRQMFDNAAEYADLYREEVPEASPSCVERLSDGYALEAIRARLGGTPVWDHAYAAAPLTR